MLYSLFVPLADCLANMKRLKTLNSWYTPSFPKNVILGILGQIMKEIK
jgi:hypothetical protein